MYLNMRQREVLEKRILNHLKVIKCKGYSQHNRKDKKNQELFYKEAKTPIGDFNKTELKSIEEIDNWLRQGGWIAIRLKNISVVDVDKNDYKIRLINWYINQYFKNKPQQPVIQKTKNGFHYFFKQFTHNNKPFNNSDYLSELGVNLTVKSGENAYVLIEPSEGKEWLTEPDFNNLPKLPDALKPLDKNDKNKIIDAIVRNIAFCYQNELLNGYEDIELSFCYFLIKENFSDDYIHKCFKFIYPDYDYSRTDSIIERTKERLKSGEEVKGFKSFYEKIKDDPKFKVLRELFELYFKIKNNNKGNSKQNHEIRKIEAEVIENLEDLETIEDLPDFPIEVFPKPFKELVKNIADAYNVPVETPAATLLFLTGGSMGATRQVKITDNYKIYPNLYMAIIAESGMRKSPPIKYMLKPIFKRDMELTEEYNAKLEEYQKELELYKIEKARFEKEAKKSNSYISKEDYPNPPEPPIERKYLIDDITIEKIAESLSHNPRGLMAYYDELRSLLSGFGKYSKVEAAESEKAFFDKCFDGMYHKYERKSSKSIVLPRPLLSIYGAIQPEVFKFSFKNKDLMSGFFQRWIFYHIPKKKMDDFIGITTNIVSKENYDLLSKFIGYLLNFDFNLENNPLQILVNNESLKVFDDYYRKIDYQIKTDTLGNGFSGFLSKARNLPAKFALHLLAMGCFLKGVNLTEEIYIPAEIMQLGCIISDWFITHTKYMWEYYLDDEILLDIQPVDEMIIEAIIDLFESGKVKNNVVFTKDIKDWLELNKKLTLRKEKIGNILKKYKISSYRTSKKRGWLVTEDIIKILKDKLTTSTLKVNNNDSDAQVTPMTHNIKVRHSDFNNKNNQLEDKMTRMTQMTQNLKNKSFKLNNSQNQDNISDNDNPFLDDDINTVQPAKPLTCISNNKPEDNNMNENYSLDSAAAENISQKLINDKPDDNFIKIEKGEIIIDEDKLDIYKTQPLEDIPDYQPETKPIPYNELKKFYFDIETTGLDPKTSQLICIGVMDDASNVKIFKGKENKILLEFNAYILKEKPDILAGHNIFNFDIPYLVEKSKQHKIKPIFELIKEDKVIGNTSWNGKPITIDLYKCTTKQVNLIDTFILTAKYDYSARKLKSYNLKNAVIELKLREDRRLELSKDDIVQLFNSGDLNTIEEYLKYDLEDTKLLADLFIPQYYYQLELFKPETRINLQNLCLMG